MLRGPLLEPLRGEFRLLTCGLGNERQNAPLAVDHHGDLAKQATGAQAMFDFLGLDAKAADFHLIVAPPAQLDSRFGPFAQVAAAVGAQALAVRQGQLQVTLGGLLRVVQIAQRHARADDVQLAHLLLRHRLLGVIENQHPAVGDGRAEQAVVVAAAHRASGGQHRGFGGAIQVAQARVGREALNRFGLAHIAAGHEPVQPQRFVAGQQAEQGGRQKAVGQALFAQQRGQLQRIAALAVAGHDQRRTLDQRWEDVDQRGVEPQGGELQDPALFIQLAEVGIPGAKMAEVVLAKHYAFRLARRA